MISPVDNYKSWKFSSLFLVIRGFHVIKKSTLTRNTKKIAETNFHWKESLYFFSTAYEKVSPGNLWDEILNCLMFNFSLHFFLFHWTPSYFAAMKERKVSFQEEKQREKSSFRNSITFTIINRWRRFFSVYTLRTSTLNRMTCRNKIRQSFKMYNSQNHTHRVTAAVWVWAGKKLIEILLNYVAMDSALS